MGCGSSNGATEPGEERVNWNKDAEIDDEFKEDDSGTVSDAKKEIRDFEDQEWNHDIAFSRHKRLSCLSHTSACCTDI